MSKLILYTSELSPATRATKMLIRYLDLDVEFRPIDIGSNEQRKPDFMKLNPTHTLPTLDDNGFILWDGHAISTYLIGKYAGNNHELYPTDVKKRAEIDQFLHFNGRTLFPRFFTFVMDVFWREMSEPAELQVENAIEAIGFLNTFLETSQYLTGDTLTLADILCSTVPLTFQRLLPDAFKNKNENVSAWIERVRKALPYFDEINNEKLDELVRSFFAQKEANKTSNAAPKN